MADSEGSNSSSEMSEDFQERLSELKAKWKAALKRNKKLLLKCPNYNRCQFKCGSVGGMHYHFVRCAGNAPQFKCHQCSRQYESRTGLNYHMASSHGNEPVDDLKSDSPSRPQRSAAITTLSAIHISSNPPPLKQHLSPHKPPPTATKTPPTSNKTTPTSNKTPPTTVSRQLEEHKPVQTTTKRTAVTPPPPSSLTEEQPIKMSKKSLTPPTSKHAGTKRVKGEGGSRQKKNKYVTIPSIEYPDEYKSFLPLWRQEMKDNKIIKCPNFEECEFKCTTVNGMKYHYVRCMKSNPPEFNCELCDKKFQCRTGLVWHLKKTHKLIDIQPSKTGGFKGTIPTDAIKMSGVDEILGLTSSTAAVIATVSPPLSSRPGRKKIKLEQKGSMLLGKTRMLLSNNGRKSDGSRHRARKRLRKSTSPRRTAYHVLQNVLLKHSSKPKLGPQTKKLHLPVVEFIIADDIPTDIDPQPSAIIQLGEEALQWQKMYSDSEGESDYNPDGEDNSRHFEFQSNSSASDSDEDYTCSFSTAKKKRGPKPGTKYSEKMTNPRGLSRKGRGGKIMDSKDVPMFVQPPEDVQNYLFQPPPLLVKQDKQSELRTAHVPPPALIKTSNINKQSNHHDVTEEFDRLTNMGVDTLHANEGNEMVHHMTTPTHVQPPPSLVMPAPQLREPPPLVKKEEGNSPSSALYPHIVLPSATEQPTSHSSGSKRTTNLPEGVTTIPPVVPTPAPGPRRPGRPRKDQSNTSQSGLKTSSKTVRLGSTKAHYKPSKGAKGQTSSYSVKGMKMTQYEFQSVSMAPHHLTTPTLSTSHQHTPQQHVVLTPGNSGVQVPNVQNVMAPLQIIPASLHYPNISSVPGGSVLYVQGAPQGVALATPQGNEMSTTYITQDGNTYQLVQATPAQVGDDNAQKVSVIMHPGTTGGTGGIQYITQLDGPPPKVSKNTTSSTSSKDLRKRFEEARRTERAKLDGSLQQRTGSTRTSGSRLQSSPSSVGVSVSESLSDLNIGMESNPQTHSSSNSGVGTRHEHSEGKKNPSPEELMSVQLKSYFKMEQARKAKCLSPPLSGRSKDPSTFNVAASASPIPNASCRSEKMKQKIRSSRSVSRGESTSPTRNVKSPKSPRLVVSPTLFSPTHSSTKSERSNDPVIIEQTSFVSGESETNTKCSPSIAKRRRQQTSVAKPDLQNLFFPDNINVSPQKTTNSTSSESISKKSPPYTSNRPVDFSSTLQDPTSSGLKRPTPIQQQKGHSSITVNLQHNSNHSNSNETTTTTTTSATTNSSNKEDNDSSASSTSPDNSPSPSLETTPTKQPLALEVQPSCLKLGKHSHSETDDVGESSGVSLTVDSSVVSTPPAKMRRKYTTRKSSEQGSSSSKAECSSPATSVTTRRRGRGGKAKQSPSKTPPQRTKIKTPTTVGEVEPMDTGELVESTPPGGSIRKTPKSRGRPKKKTLEKKVYDCPKCDKQYTTEAGLKGHLITVHAVTGITADSPISECLKVWKQMFKLQKSVLCVKCGTHKANSISAMRYHWQKCGRSKDEVAVSCPHCSKMYQSKAGLAYHINVQHTTKPEPGRQSSSPHQQKQSPSPLSSPKDIFARLPARKAAKQAAEKLTEFISKEPTTSQNADSADVPVDTSEKEVVMVGSLSESQLTQVKAQFAREGIMTCPIESCTKTFKSLPGLRYHLRHHEEKKQLQCPLCKKLILSRKRMENHLRSKHPAFQLENLDDLEYTPPIVDDDNDEESEDSDLEEVQDDLLHDGDDKEDIEHKKPSKMKSSGATISSYSVPRTFKEYHHFIGKLLERLYSQEVRCELSKKEWQAKTTDWASVSGSELNACLPKATSSINFIFSSSSPVKRGEEFSLPLFGSTGTDFPVTTFFAGGPVWVMDWLPVKDVKAEQFVALSAYRELDERYPTEGQFSHQGLIQLWSMGLLENNKDCSDTCVPQLPLGIAHNFGCIRAMKWYPDYSINSSNDDGDDPARLGILAIGCTDGYVRILSIPEPKTLAAAFPTKKKRSSPLKQLQSLSEKTLFVKPKKETALLVPHGGGTSDNSVFGQCLCLDWLPGNKHTRIAAGFSNGSVCVWDFSSSFLRSSSSSSSSSSCHAADSQSGTLIIHPLTQLSAHSAPCRCVVWCPHNHNYLFSGGHDKLVALWDLRHPFSPVEKQERGSNIVYEMVWPMLWCSIIGVLDTSLGLQQPNNSLFYMTYLHSLPGLRNQRAITSSSAPLCTESYSLWTDRVAAGSFGGEISVLSFPSSFHVTHAKSIQHFHKMIYSCRMEPLCSDESAMSEKQPQDEETTSGVDKSKVSKCTDVKNGHSSTVDVTATADNSNGQALTTTMEELAQSHKLVFKDYHSKDSSSLPFSTDILPLHAFTKICWNPNEGSCNWLLLGTNSGLVQLLHVAPPSTKPGTSYR